MLLLTGQSGNLGQSLSRQLKEANAPLASVGRLEITDKNALIKSLKNLIASGCKPTQVIHCAALTNVAEIEKNPAQAFLVNEVGTRNLLEALREVKLAPWVCYVSTSHVYKYKAQPEKLIESDELAPRSNYAQSKLQGEVVAEKICKENDLPLMIARVFSYYSHEQKDSFVVPKLAKLVLQAKKGEKIKTGWLGAYRDFLEVSDVSRALVLAMEARLTGAFNICSGEGVSIRNFLDRFIDMRRTNEKDFSVEVEEGSPRADDVSWIVGSNKKISDAIKFTPQVSLTTGLAGLWHGR